MQMATISGKTFWCLCSAALILAAASARAEQKLFESVQVTPAGEYTFGIEGPAVDLDGNLYVVNFGRQGAIGKLALGSTASEKFIDTQCLVIEVDVSAGWRLVRQVADDVLWSSAFANLFLQITKRLDEE